MEWYENHAQVKGFLNTPICLIPRMLLLIKLFTCLLSSEDSSALQISVQQTFKLKWEYTFIENEEEKINKF